MSGDNTSQPSRRFDESSIPLNDPLIDTTGPELFVNLDRGRDYAPLLKSILEQTKTPVAEDKAVSAASRATEEKLKSIDETLRGMMRLVETLQTDQARMFIRLGEVHDLFGHETRTIRGELQKMDRNISTLQSLTSGISPVGPRSARVARVEGYKREPSEDEKLEDNPDEPVQSRERIIIPIEESDKNIRAETHFQPRSGWDREPYDEDEGLQIHTKLPISHRYDDVRGDEDAGPSSSSAGFFDL